MVHRNPMRCRQVSSPHRARSPTLPQSSTARSQTPADRQTKAEADATPPAGRAHADLAKFYYDRGTARAQLGRLNESTADANKAIEVARGAVDANLMGRIEQFAGLQYSAAGDPKQAFAIFSRQIREANVPGAKGYLFGGNRQISGILIQMGDIPRPKHFLNRNLTLIQEARTSGLPGWRSSYAVRGQSWEADVEYNRAIIFEARGQFRDAESSYRLAEQRRRASVKGILSSPQPAARNPDVASGGSDGARPSPDEGAPGPTSPKRRPMRGARFWPG